MTGTFGRKAICATLAGLALLGFASPAAAQPPFAALFIEKSGQLALAAPLETVNDCRPISLGVFASDPDGLGLGFPVFAPFGNNTPITVIWNFGNAIPQGNLQVFNLTPLSREEMNSLEQRCVAQLTAKTNARASGMRRDSG